MLWVLGERNAKNLRGQSMEDVIFSGSSARKPVGLAEVELLLDNSDGTLPVDFDEVSIGRRMYRSGESEYLINGSIVRRMDVLDILHDSGLGTGTHSIISQGNLDSVLSSKPEDRRALIEEAAGILKHKERKMKSERKLARMDNHLARLIHVTSEVERQLKPLERKAKKALTFQDLDAQRSDLKLRVSVDDLRLLQKQWEETEEKEQSLARKLNEHQDDLVKAEQTLDELQNQLKERGLKENNLNVSLRSAQNAHERLNSAKMLLREKRRQATQELERVVRLFEESKINEKRAQEELSSATEQYKQAQKAYLEAQEKQATKEAAYASLVSERNIVRKQIDTLTAEQRGFVHRKETIEAAQKALSENLSATRAKAQVLEAQLVDAKARLQSSQREEVEQAKHEKALSEEYEHTQQLAVEARDKLNASLQVREEARRKLLLTRNAVSLEHFVEIVHHGNLTRRRRFDAICCRERTSLIESQLSRLLLAGLFKVIRLKGHAAHQILDHMRIGSRYAQNAREAFGRQPQYHIRIHFERIRDGVFHRRGFRIGVVVFLNRATHRLDELPDQTHQIILLKHVRNPVLSNGVPARRCAESGGRFRFHSSLA